MADGKTGYERRGGARAAPRRVCGKATYDMADSVKRGDEVTWKSQGKTVEGTVEKKLTRETKIQGHAVKASPDNPEYLVKSDATGKEAAHRPDALRKKK